MTRKKKFGSDAIKFVATNFIQLKTGIVEGHAYSLISVHEVTSKEKSVGSQGELVFLPKIEHLVRIRNPWARTEWNGDWSDGSNKWTQETKQQVE